LPLNFISTTAAVVTVSIALLKHNELTELNLRPYIFPVLKK